MTKIHKVIILITLLIIIGNTQVAAKKKCLPKIFAYGVSYSFTDTIIYITSIQEIDSAWVDGKSEFLVDRNYYSYQLKEYFNKKNDMNRVCAIFYAKKHKDITKKYIKMMKKFSKRKNIDIRQIPDTEFQFKTEIPDQESLIEKQELTKAERKALKAAAKKDKKQSKKKKAQTEKTSTT